MAQSRTRNGIYLRMLSSIATGSPLNCATETILDGVVLSADYLVSGAIITIASGIIKSGAAGTFTIKLYFNTSLSTSGALQMGQYSVTAANTSPSVSRTFVFDSATTAQGLLSTSNASGDNGTVSNVSQSYTFTSWLANGGHFFITGLRLTGTETLQSVKMTIEV
jgi:hypothetical protein